MARAASETRKIAVLTSGHGRGSNLRALHQAFAQNNWPLRIAFATASRDKVPVVRLCAELGLPCHILNPCCQEAFEARLLELCREERIELIALAGFMKLLSPTFLDQVGVPVLNIHPALLPAHGGPGMYGIRVHEAVFAAGERFSGATVHLVDPLYDHGKIIAQAKVDISDCLSPEAIAARVLEVEHRLYAAAIHNFLGPGWP